MSDLDRQKLSQFMDGDLSREEASRLFMQMQNNSEVRSQLHRYQIARQAMQDAPQVKASTDFASQVMARLEQEPVYSRPQKQVHQVSSFKMPWLAIAASVSALAIALPLLMKNNAGPVPGEMRMVMAPQNSVVPVDMNGRVRSYPVNQRFEDYLQAHNGSLYVSGASRYRNMAQLASYGRE